MTPTEQMNSSISVTSPITKTPDVEALKTARLSNAYSSDVYSQYNVTASMMNNTYSPIPGIQSNNNLYPTTSYSQYGNQATVLPSPPFIHSTIGSPSPSVTSYSNHPHHYTNTSSLPLSSPASQSPSHPTMRTVYLGNVAPDTQLSDILDQIRSGVIETVRPLPEKNCVFITFIDAIGAAHFYHEVSTRLFTVNGVELKVGWGKPSVLSTNLRLALQNGVSRNVFLGSLDESVNEDVIREDLKRFGTIEHVRLIREKNIAFVHFLTISNAVKCVNSLPSEGDWQNRRVYYGKDRCCQVTPTSTAGALYTNASVSGSPYPPHPHYHSHSPSQHGHHQPIHVQHAYQVRYPPSIAYDPYTGATIETYPPVAPASSSTSSSSSAAIAGSGISNHHPSTTLSPPMPMPQTSATPTTVAQHLHHPHLQLHPNQPASLVPALSPVHADLPLYHHSHATNNGAPNSLAGVANRTIYLGNIHPDTTCEEICNVIRGGILSQIRYMVDKHIAFIAFVDPVLALHFYTQATYHGIVIKSRRLKIGWGKPSSLPGAVIQAVQNGGSRNVYLGNMDDSMTEEKLKQDFSEYGDIELVNTLKEKNCAFVNFTSIAAAMRAIEGIRTKEEYKRFRINYGKDRCGNPPRSLQQPPTVPAAFTVNGATVKPPSAVPVMVVNRSAPTTASTSSSSSTTNTAATTNGIVTVSNVATGAILPSKQDLLLMDASNGSSTATTGLNIIDSAAAAFTAANTLGVTPLPDIIVPSSTPLHLQGADVDDHIDTNGILNSVLDA